MKKNIIAAGMIGEILEWYDFTLYGFFAPVLAALFFPSHNPFLSILATFGGFAAGYLLRPVGGFLFGHFGDRIGRKKVLAYTLILMSAPTVLIGLLPTYQSIGILAPILLVLLRLIQGLSCGGEYTGSMIFLYEHAPEHRQGLFSSLAVMGSFIGGMFSVAAVGITTATMSTMTLHAFGWRLPFLFAIFTAIIGFYIRMKIADTPVFEQIKRQGNIIRIPLADILKQHKRKLFNIMGINVQVAVLSYIILIYAPTYLTKFVGLTLTQVMLLNIITISSIFVTVPLFGILADKIGAKPILIFSAIGTILATYPSYILFTTGNFELVLLGEVIFALLISSTMATGPKIMAGMVPAKLRYSSVSIGHGICDSMFGGTAPLIATLLINNTNNILSPAYYIILASLFTLFIVVQLQDKSREFSFETSDELISS